MSPNTVRRRSARIATTGSRVSLALGLLFVVALTAGCESRRAPNRVATKFKGVDAITAIDGYIAEHPVDKNDPDWRLRVPRPPFVAFDADRRYYWFLHTSEGLIKIRLFTDTAPRHVSSTIYLTRLGFYSDLPFHRVIPGFMMQGGDPLGTGLGDPGFRYGGELRNGRSHKKFGIVSMANAGPRTDGSQFFILFKAAANLDGKHAVFGEVVEGGGTVKSIERYGSESGEPKKPIMLRSAEILVELGD
jgi:cyclophilin family peptidyl-prolyl cis-trans isomerase